jgi:hypothetical protein
MIDDVQEIRVDGKMYRSIECATIIQESRLWPDDTIAAARSGYLDPDNLANYR